MVGRVSTRYSHSPVFIMEKGSSRVFGREAQRMNIAIVKTIAEAIRSSLGPKGMDKMLIDKDGIVWVTNDGSTILSRIDVEHPAAKMLVEMAEAINSEVGDGTISTIILAGNFLKNCERLLDRKIHPAVIMEGYLKAVSKTLSLMEAEAIKVSSEDGEVLKQVAMTAVTGRLVSEDREHIANLAVEAVLKVAENIGGRIEVDLQKINLRKRIGGSIAETKLVDGFAFFRELAHFNMPHRVEKAKILIVKDELRIRKWGRTQRYEHNISIETLQQMRDYWKQRDDIYRSIAERIKEIGANVVIVEKGIDASLLDHLARLKILAVRRVVIEDLERIAWAVGAKIITDLNHVSPEDLGEAELVEERKLEGQPWIFIEGCKKPKSLTILIRGSQDYVLDEVERALENAIHAVRNVLRKPAVVVGGGALEAELAFRLRQWAKRLPSREQFAVESFADALESIPLTLAENSGLDPMDTLVALRLHHAKGETQAGVDAFNRKISNMAEMKVFEPLLVKEQIIKAASEIIITILKISDYLAGRKLSKQEFYKRQREEATTPERIKKIHREYGIEGPYT